MEADLNLKVPFAALPQLSEEQVEDAEFQGKDLGWSEVVRVFEARRAEEKITLESLGGRIGKPRSQVHRWISSPLNMTMRALGLLAEGLDADLVLSLRPRETEPAGQNHCHPAEAAKVWIEADLRPQIRGTSIADAKFVIDKQDVAAWSSTSGQKFRAKFEYVK